MNPTSNISQLSFGHNQNEHIPCSNYASMITRINRGNMNVNGNMNNTGTHVSNSNPYVTSVGSNYLGDTSAVISNPYQVSNGFHIHLDSASTVGRQRTVQFTNHVTYDEHDRATRTAQTDTVRTNGIRSSVLQPLDQRTSTLDNGIGVERRSFRGRRDQPRPNRRDDVQDGYFYRHDALQRSNIFSSNRNQS